MPYRLRDLRLLKSTGSAGGFFNPRFDLPVECYQHYTRCHHFPDIAGYCRVVAKGHIMRIALILMLGTSGLVAEERIAIPKRIAKEFAIYTAALKDGTPPEVEAVNDGYKRFRFVAANPRVVPTRCDFADREYHVVMHWMGTRQESKIHATKDSASKSADWAEPSVATGVATNGRYGKTSYSADFYYYDKNWHVVEMSFVGQMGVGSGRINRESKDTNHWWDLFVAVENKRDAKE